MQPTLEKVIKKRVRPVVDEALHKFLGIRIDELSQDISDKIETKPLVKFVIDTSLSFKSSKKLFKKQFMESMIVSHYGNVSLAAKLSGLNRRSIHRAIKDLNIDVDKCRKEMLKPEYYKKEVVDSILRTVLDNYKQIIHPSKLQQMYDNVPSISSDIVREVSLPDMTWKQAEQEFEKEYLTKVLEQNDNNLASTARRIKLRYETLLRKLKALGLKIQS
jgi:transcriptional regulator with GAF, ATPase, and Fis domain